jgi:hypothetical protein
MGGSCEYIEREAVDSRQGEILQIAKNIQKRASDLDGLFR